MNFRCSTLYPIRSTFFDIAQTNESEKADLRTQIPSKHATRVGGASSNRVQRLWVRMPSAGSLIYVRLLKNWERQ